MNINTPEHDEAVEKIEEAAANANATIRTDYSGRGMYGKICYGIEGDMTDILLQVGKVGLPRPKMDSMGIDTIVYWPNIEGVRDESEEDQDDVG